MASDEDPTSELKNVDFTPDLEKLKIALDKNSETISEILRKLKSPTFNPSGTSKKFLFETTIIFKKNLNDYEILVKSIPESIAKTEHSIYLNSFKKLNKDLNQNNNSFLSFYAKQKTNKLAKAPRVPTNLNREKAKAAREMVLASKNQSRRLANLRKKHLNIKNASKQPQTTKQNKRNRPPIQNERSRTYQTPDVDNANVQAELDKLYKLDNNLDNLF
jgi:hypothetical protein